VDNTFTFGGAIQSLGVLLRGLAEQAVEPFVITGQPRDAAEERFPGVPVECWDLRLPWLTPDPIAGDPTAGGLERLSTLERMTRNLYWLFTGTIPTAKKIAEVGWRQRIDLIHLNNIAESQPEALLAARLLRVPCVAHCRTHPDPELLSARVMAGMPDHQIAISHSVSDGLLDAGVPADRITVVPNGVELDRFEPGPAPAGLAAELGLPPGVPVVGHVGRIVEWKGQLEFLEAFAGVARERPEARALVVGDRSDGGEAYEAAVRERADRPDLSGRVVFTGYRPDVADVMRLCDVVAHTSIEPEPFGRGLIEAMALGTPIVAASRGGPLDIVREGETGYLADPTEAEAVGTAILRLLSDAELRQRMGRAAIERTRRLFSREAHAAAVAEVYAEVLARRRRATAWSPRPTTSTSSPGAPGGAGASPSRSASGPA